MGWELTVVAAVTPALLLVWYFQKRDIYPEPPRILWTTFGLGVLCALPAILLALPFYFLGQAVAQVWPGAVGVLAAGAIHAFLSAAMCEEACKLGVLLRYSFRRREFNEPMDGIVYGAVASLGFAAIENVFYAFQGGFSGSVMRAFTAVPMHACVGAIMGMYVGRARHDPLRRNALILRGYLIAVLLHGSYDFPLLSLRSYIESRGGDESQAGGFAALALVLAMIVLAGTASWTASLVRAARRLQEERRLLAACAPVARPLDLAADAGGAGPATALDVPVRTVPPYSTSPRRRASRAIPTALTAIGAVLACWGGAILLAVLVRILRADVSPADWERLAYYGSLLGLLPALAGVLCFSNGVRRLNAAAS